MIPKDHRYFPKLNVLSDDKAFHVTVSAYAECLIVIVLIAQFLSELSKGRPTRQVHSALPSAHASFHPISCGMATSRNWPRRRKHAGASDF
jgi:hypothetical protein